VLDLRVKKNSSKKLLSAQTAIEILWTPRKLSFKMQICRHIARNISTSMPTLSDKVYRTKFILDQTTFMNAALTGWYTYGGNRYLACWV